MDIVLDIKDRLSIFKSFYDAIRVVDPIKKKVISDHIDENCNHNLVIKDDFSMVNCHNIWKKNSRCGNCVAKKAYLENDTFVKLEYSVEKIFLVIASPVEIEGKRYVVELLKDITENGEIVDRCEEATYLDIKMSNIGETIVKDYLTGVYNRRYINNRLLKEIERNLNRDMPTTIIMADIDWFKNINDTYGHLIGDKILKDFAGVLNENIRISSDWIGRYGGEEFLIVLNDTDKKNGVLIAEKLRKIVENKKFIYDNIKISLTASFGVFEISKKEDISDIIKHVDNKLYNAKMTGRNKIMF